MKKYFIFKDGIQQGPFSFEELRMMNISPQAHVWFAGMNAWRSAAEIPELQSLFGMQQNFYPQNSFQQQQQENQPVKLKPWVWITIGTSVLAVISIIVVILFHKKNTDEDRMHMALVMDSLRADSIAKDDAMKQAADSMMMVMMHDSTMVADSLAAQYTDSLPVNYNDSYPTASNDNPPSYYTGTFKSSTGATIVVSGKSNSNLNVTADCFSSGGNNAGHFTSSAWVRESNKIETSGYGCTLTILYVTPDIISVTESGCDASHQSGYQFAGAYQKE